MEALIAIHPISIQEMVSLLGYWRPHSEFQTWLEQKLLSLLPVFESQILFYEDILEKIYILNLDKLLPFGLGPLFSHRKASQVPTGNIPRFSDYGPFKRTNYLFCQTLKG
jgi:hypothetical protein